MPFKHFNLHPSVTRGLAPLGFTAPTPVQEAAIPLILQKRDAIIQAKTGSGKTLAFGLPILSMLERQGFPQALVVLPTRELAQQVCSAIAEVKGRLRVLPIYGGARIEPQERALKEGVDLVVGTPGRLKDLINRGSLDLRRVRILILDEADAMLDMGFRRDIDFLLKQLPLREQTLIFSATMPSEIEVIARSHLKNPAYVNLIKDENV
ncbi:MAG TPA: DEAD/DEAH box helicase, partial [Chroococcales cyanobacterium]